MKNKLEALKKISKEMKGKVKGIEIHAKDEKGLKKGLEMAEQILDSKKEDKDIEESVCEHCGKEKGFIMAKVMTTDALVEDVFRKSSTPENDDTFSAADIRRMLNSELESYILPIMLRVHEEYYVRTEFVDLVAGTTEYDIPYRAVGSKLRDVQYKDSNGNRQNMARVSLEDLPEYNESASYGNNYSFYMKSNQVNLISNTQSTGSIAMDFFLRPSELVKDSRAGVISAINTSTGLVTVTTFPDHFNSQTSFDFVAAKSPNKILAYDKDKLSSDSTLKTVTFTASDLPSKLAIGDYLVAAEETIVPQLPTELQSLLTQKTACKVLESLSDAQALALSTKELERQEFAVNSLIDNRVNGAPQKINNKYSPLRQAVRGRGSSRGGF